MTKKNVKMVSAYRFRIYKWSNFFCKKEMLEKWKESKGKTIYDKERDHVYWVDTDICRVYLYTQRTKKETLPRIWTVNWILYLKLSR